jgi:hypothetical protein
VTTPSRHRRRYPTLTDEQYRRSFRAEELPPQPWKYTITPRLVQNLVRVADAAGQMRASPLSYYRQRELAAQAKRMRVQWYASGTRGVTAEEVDAVLRGARLPEKRQAAREMIARAALVEDALAHFTSTTAKGRRLTPEVAMVYRFCTLGRAPGIPAPKGLQLGEPNWTLFAPRERAKLLDTQREATEVRPEVKAIFDWADHDPLVSSSTVLRAATIFWGLTLLDPSWHAVSVVLHHEFRVGDIDASGLLMLTEATVAQRELLTTPSDRMVTADEGDLTSYFEEFSWSLSLVLGERLEQLGRVQSNEAFLPWKVVAPSDELDAQLYDVLERLGKAGSAAILKALGSDAPPLRTVQRRLQKLVGDGVFAKRGARKNAVYALADRDPAA